jgi:hypothetical protein
MRMYVRKEIYGITESAYKSVCVHENCDEVDSPALWMADRKFLLCSAGACLLANVCETVVSFDAYLSMCLAPPTNTVGRCIETAMNYLKAT